MRILAVRTVQVLRACHSVTAIALATPEEELAAELDVEVVPDRGSLNGAVQDAVAWSLGLGATTLLIVPADLPEVTEADIEQLIAASPHAPSVTLSPTKDGGTGAMLLRPPDLIAPRYGPGSFALHTEAAKRAGATVTEVLLEGFCRDLDTIEDLHALEKSGL